MQVNINHFKYIAVNLTWQAEAITVDNDDWSGRVLKY